MENKIKNINQESKFDNEDKKMKNEDCNVNIFHFSFENKIDLTDINFLSNIILESENEKIVKNEINDFEEDNKEENSVFETILNDLNKNIEINLKEHENENNINQPCQEILDILTYPLSDKNIRNGISPFKPMLKPKKISLIGKVLSDMPIDVHNNNNSHNNTHNNTTENTTSNANNNGKVIYDNIESIVMK
jgi:hypothetical protein